MSQTATYVDAEGPIRTWLRGQAIDGVSTRVFLGLPERCAFPALELQLLDGGIQPGEAPLANALFTFSAWGGSRIQAAAAAYSLVSRLLSTAAGTDLDATLVFMGARVVAGPTFRPDPDGKPRYVVDAAITVRVPA